MYGIYLRGAAGREKLGEVTGPDMMRALAQATKLIVSAGFDLSTKENQPRYRVSSVHLDGVVPLGTITWENPYYTEVDVVDLEREHLMLGRTEAVRYGRDMLTAGVMS